ncbi:glycosyltransferase family A protein [Fodinibius saliphilus]|uniref:glycosyltransferase family A protein n=1 Tax=Fodinibius saliphilus TaxID=1920650 RepID=UPI001109DDC4|nr:glycosyltransferase family A protein [Fodinibius saliphilus]
MSYKINILVSTIDSGIQDLDTVILDPKSNVKYIVSHQYTDEKYKKIPDFLEREDIIVSQIFGRGVTKSRNNAIRLADGEIGLFADDDVTYKESYFDRLEKRFKENPNLDVALFKIKTGRGEPEYKNYPNKVVQYTNAPSVGTVEMAFRIKKIRDKGICFDERFGAGQELLIGADESIFVQDCIDAGLKVKFFPEYIVGHPFESSVKTIPKYDKRRIWVTGGFDCRINGPIALVKAFLGTVKNLPDLLRHKKNPIAYFYHRISAVLYILKTNNNQRKL